MLLGQSFSLQYLSAPSYWGLLSLLQVVLSKLFPSVILCYVLFASILLSAPSAFGPVHHNVDQSPYPLHHLVVLSSSSSYQCCHRLQRGLLSFHLLEQSPRSTHHGAWQPSSLQCRDYGHCVPSLYNTCILTPRKTHNRTTTQCHVLCTLEL